MFCPSCGNEIRESDRFCGHCGHHNGAYTPNYGGTRKMESDGLGNEAPKQEPMGQTQTELHGGPIYEQPPMTASQSYNAYDQRPIYEDVNMDSRPQEVHESPVYSIITMILGIVGAGYGIASLIMAIIGLKKYKTQPNRKKLKIGLGFSIAWMVILPVLIILYVVLILMLEEIGGSSYLYY